MSRGFDSNQGTGGGRGRGLARLIGPERAAQLRDTGERWLVHSPERGWAVVTLAVSAVLIGLAMMWMQRQVLLAPGQIMSDTRAVRVELWVQDDLATERVREGVRQRSPRVYALNDKLIEDVGRSLEEVLRAAGGARTVDEVPAAVQKDFALQPEQLAELRRTAADGPRTVAWTNASRELVRLLGRVVVVTAETARMERQAVNRMVEVLHSSTEGGTQRTTLSTGDVYAVDSGEWASRAAALVEEAGFAMPLRGVAVRRITDAIRQTPLASYDEQATASLRAQAAAAVPPLRVQFAPGQLIYTRGDRLTPEQFRLAQLENAEYWESNRNPLARLHDLAALGLAIVFVVGIGLVIATYSPQIALSPRRMTAVAGMIVGAVVTACAVSVSDPRLTMMAVTAPAVFVATTLAVAYDRRVALALGTMLTILTCVTLEQSALACVVGIVGVVVGVRSLREVRYRHTLIVATMWAAGAVMVVGLAVGVLTRPVLLEAARQATAEGSIAAAAVLLCGFVILGIVPIIERVFGITTGLTLIELRDPSHPLLRQLQQQAPGTYNHSLNVAALAEAAATAIGADSLLAYVGSLYHDVGKMNKPEYFVENQTPGFNRHERLTPAMSLLVIVGHVKDGVELAREYRLPEGITHFIESHHGTTLVEYFFHRARKQAEAQRMDASDEPGLETPAPQEFEYRYPGPKPASREAAILMVCDASESAARAMTDPSPMRIDSMVRAIAHKRLMDGQFDQSDLTLAELTLVIEAVSRSLASIYHARIAYPGDNKPGGQAGVVKVAGAETAKRA